MHSNQRFSSLGIALLAALGMADVASAQAIIITNSNNHQIPLRSGSSVQIDVDGNLLAECALNASNVCTQLSSGSIPGGAGAPVATLTRSDSNTAVVTGESITLNWSSTAAVVCSAAATGPTTTWGGPKTVGGSETVSFSAVGDYTFTLTCFNPLGGSTVQTVAVNVAEAPVEEIAGCNIQSTDPAFRPTNFAAINKLWGPAVRPPDDRVLSDPVYPNSLGTPTPIGSNKGTYTAIKFTSQANTTVDMTWDTAQAQRNYAPRPADSMFIAISPCPGDLRAANSAAGDPWLQPGCRKVAGSASMYYTTKTSYGPSNDNFCKLEPNKEYYINVAPVDPGDGLTTGEHTCSGTAANSATGCDVQMVHSGSSF